MDHLSLTCLQPGRPIQIRWTGWKGGGGVGVDASLCKINNLDWGAGVSNNLKCTGQEVILFKMCWWGGIPNSKSISFLIRTALI